MTRCHPALVALFGFFAAVGCDQKDQKPADTPAKAAEAQPAPAPEAKAQPQVVVAQAAAAAPAAAPAPVAAPAVVANQRMAIGMGLTGVVQTVATTVSVRVANETDPKDLDAARTAAASRSPTKQSDERLGDGWVFLFEGGGNYFVQVRRELSGTAYWCESTDTTPEQQAAALAFCKSLALAEPAAPIPAGRVELAPLPLTAVSPTMQGLQVSIGPAQDGNPKDLATARGNAQGQSPTKQSDETLTDGWVLTFEAPGDGGTKYVAQVRREIAGTAYWCEGTETSADRQLAVIDFCKSLAPR
jgi:hypothetical protein